MNRVKLIPFGKARIQVEIEARKLVHAALDRFGQIATPQQVEYAVTQITNAVMTTMRLPREGDAP